MISLSNSNNINETVGNVASWVGGKVLDAAGYVGGKALDVTGDVLGAVGSGVLATGKYASKFIPHDLGLGELDRTRRQWRDSDLNTRYGIKRGIKYLQRVPENIGDPVPDFSKRLTRNIEDIKRETPYLTKKAANAIKDFVQDNPALSVGIGTAALAGIAYTSYRYFKKNKKE